MYSIYSPLNCNGYVVCNVTPGLILLDVVYYYRKTQMVLSH